MQILHFVLILYNLAESTEPRLEQHPGVIRQLLRVKTTGKQSKQLAPVQSDCQWVNLGSL